jgi:type I restriction enzyme S subunit
MSEMVRGKISDLITLQRGQDLPQSKMVPGNIPVFGSSGIIGFHNKANVIGGGVVIGRSGTVGFPTLVKTDFFAHNTLLYVKDFKGNNHDYIYYLLKLLKVWKKRTSTSVPTLDRKNVHDIEITYHKGFCAQEETIRSIKLIDQKIELNNRINAELEQLAKTVYDYWFVQFDFPNAQGKPYKSSGGEMVYIETLKRKIPKDWKVKILGDIVHENKQTLSAATDKSKLYSIDLSKMPSNTLCLNARGNATDFDANKNILKKFDILFGSIRPYLRKAGFSAFDGVLNGSIISLQSNNPVDYSFCLCTTVSDVMFQYAIARSYGGTRMPTVSSDDLLNFPIAFDETVSNQFHNIVSEFWETISSNINQNYELMELRDFLLPLLLTGQVKV